MVSMMYRDEDQLPEEPVMNGPLHERSNSAVECTTGTELGLAALKADPSDPPALCKATQDLQRQVMEYGPNHIQVAKSWGALGLFRLHVKRDTLGAIQCHREALRIYQQHFGGNNNKCCSSSLELAVAMHDLGFCYERISDTTRALDFYVKAMEHMDKVCVNVSELHPVRTSLERSVLRLRRV